MTAELLAFLFLSSLTTAGGIGAVAAKNIAHAALFLLLSLAAVAGIFILLMAEFLALVQILIYGGAITIVLLFALMLTRQDEFAHVSDNRQRPLAIVASLLLFGVLLLVFLGQNLTTQPLKGTSINELGRELLTQWAIPFEIASLVLLIALIGAIIVSRVSEDDL